MNGEAAPGRVDLGKLRIARAPEAARRPHRPWIAPLAGLGLLALAGALTAHALVVRRIPTVQTVLVNAASAGRPSVILTASGYVVTSHKYITIGTKILGQIVAEPIEEGQHVRKGEVLARIDDRDYQAQLRQAVATRDMAAANLRLASAKAARAENLKRAGVISEDDYETARSTAEAATATVESDAAAVDYAEFMVSQCVIRSPIAGIVLQKYREVGDTINYGGALQAGSGATDIAQLADTDDMRAQVDVNESDIAKITLGTPAAAVLDAYPARSFDAVLVKLYPEADRQKGTVKVEVRIARPDLQVIKPEMGVKVSFLQDRPAGEAVARISVPKSALKSDGGQAYVWLLRDGAAHRVAVVRGAETELGVEISQGLKDGDRVIIAAPGALADGQQVKTDVQD